MVQEVEIVEVEIDGRTQKVRPSISISITSIS